MGERHLYVLSHRGESLRASALVVVINSVAWCDPQGLFTALKWALFLLFTEGASFSAFSILSPLSAAVLENFIPGLNCVGLITVIMLVYVANKFGFKEWFKPEIVFFFLRDVTCISVVVFSDSIWQAFRFFFKPFFLFSCLWNYDKDVLHKS